MTKTELEEAMEDLIAEASTHEVACLNCHHMFRSLDEVRYCTRAREMGWTPLRKYEEMYREMHSTSPHLCQPPPQ